jgi:hypothetical protein
MFRHSNILAFVLFSSLPHVASAGPIIDITKLVTHLVCRARGYDNDPYLFESTSNPHNPGDPTNGLVLIWSYNSYYKHHPIARFNISAVKYDTDRKTYSVSFDSNRGNLSFSNGGGGTAQFLNPRGSSVEESLSNCGITGTW